MPVIQSVNRRAKYLYRDIFFHPSIHNTYSSVRGSRIIIYHGICKQNHLQFNNVFLTLKTFEEHLRYYKKYFNVISLDDYYAQQFSDERFNICITFDDGFANNYKYVLPLMEKYRLPATFFITAIRSMGYDILWNDFLSTFSRFGPQKIQFNNETFIKSKHNKYVSTGSGQKLADILREKGFEEKKEMMGQLYPFYQFKTIAALEDYWLQMTEEQIGRLANSALVTAGGHGHYHNDLSRIPLAETVSELKFSKTYLEDIIGREVTAFAFPYGSYNQGVVAATKAAGYNQLLAMDFNESADYQDGTMRERFTVNPFISPKNQMYANITGCYY